MKLFCPYSGCMTLNPLPIQYYITRVNHNVPGYVMSPNLPLHLHYNLKFSWPSVSRWSQVYTNVWQTLHERCKNVTERLYFQAQFATVTWRGFWYVWKKSYNFSLVYNLHSIVDNCYKYYSTYLHSLFCQIRTSGNYTHENRTKIKSYTSVH